MTRFLSVLLLSALENLKRIKHAQIIKGMLRGLQRVNKDHDDTEVFQLSSHCSLYSFVLLLHNNFFIV